MNMTSATSERRTEYVAVKQALQSETVSGSIIYIYKSGGRKSLLAASAPGIHQRLSRQLP